MAKYSGGAALGKVHYLIGTQLISRVLTFSLNTLNARWVGVSMFGLASINLYLFDTIVLVLAREGVRRGAARFANGLVARGQQGENARTKLLNVIWLGVPAGVMFSVLALWGFHRSANVSMFKDTPNPTVMLQQYQRSLLVAALATVVTLVAEPLYILAEASVLVELRALVESVAVFARCVTTFLLVAFSDAGLLSFALGQLSYSVFFSLGYWIWYLRVTKGNQEVEEKSTSPPHTTRWSAILPRKPKEDGLQVFSGELLSLVGSFWIQNVWKLVLTEGEKMALMLFSKSAADQGVYGLVHNLGSLVARFLFLPLEESAFREFSLLMGNQDKGPRATRTVLVLFQTTLKFVGLTGLVFMSFGPNYSWALLHIVYGEAWSSTSAPDVLGSYCVFVLFMAVNGVSEALLTAVISPQSLRRYNVWLLVFSAVYLVCTSVLLKFGAQGLVLANCANMAMRIAYSTIFVSRRLFPREGLGAALRLTFAGALPSLPTFLALAGAFSLTRFSSTYFGLKASFGLVSFSAHVGMGIIGLVGVGLTIWNFERQFVGNVRRIYAGKKA